MIGRDIDIVVAGDLFLDLILSGFPESPVPGTESFAKEFHREIGGGAAITACGIAKLGSQTAVLSVVGHDHGAWVTKRLASFGAITSELRFHSEEPTGFSVAISTPQERTFFSYQGANGGFLEALSEAVAGNLLTRVRHIHLAWAPPLDIAPSLFAAIRAHGCTISLDVGWHEAWLRDPRSVELFPMIDVFFPNEMEARRMSGMDDAERSLRWFEAAEARCVALKLGSLGAALLWDGDIFRAAPCAVLPVDTIGAGDCFDAGFLHYWLRGATPLNCLRAANFCGGASTQAYGGVSAFPDAERVERALRE